MHEDCLLCDKNQMKKISTVLQLDAGKEKQLLQLADDYLRSCDWTKTNPEIMGELWVLAVDFLGIDDPYKEIKSGYNQLVLKMSETIRRLIEQSTDRFQCGLKLAIAGNIIDFAVKHTFDAAVLQEMVHAVSAVQIRINHAAKLQKAVQNSRTLFYSGDNCGEIVLDKFFILLLKEYNPQLHVWYGVRGKPIINDVTMDDAGQVCMQQAADVVSNGDGSLGTVLHCTDPKFQNLFQTADVVICKGQGNYEGLLGCGKENLFFLFMAKCGLIADPLGIPVMSVVCMQNRTNYILRKEYLYGNGTIQNADAPDVQKGSGPAGGQVPD